MEKKQKILWLSDSPTTSTGFGTMTLNILNGLTEAGYECHCVAHNLPGQTIKPGMEFMDGTKVNFTIHGTGTQPYGRDKVMSLIQTLKPDFFGVLLDTFMIKQAGYQGLNFSPAISIFYYPSDGEPALPFSCEQLFTSGTFQVPVAMAKHGQAQVKKAHNIDAHYIPHAIKKGLFFPFNAERKAKNFEKWSQKLGVNLASKKVIGCVARNQGRKMLDRLIPMMKQIAAEEPDAIMLMHTDPSDAAAYFNFQYEIQKNNLENRFVFTGLNYINPYTYEEVAEIYNLMDLFLMPTTGEGFGVPIIEAMATEVPCIITDYTTTKELVVDHNAGYAIRLNDEIMGSWEVFRGICDNEDGAKKTIELLRNDKLRKQMGKNGREAVLKEYTWDLVIPQWVKLLESLKSRY